MQISGECNRCGQCCGAEDNPGASGAVNPWPKTWPAAIRNWLEEDLPGLAKVLKTPYHDGAISGVVNVGTNALKWVWVQGVGLCKGKPSNYTIECPALLGKPGDAVRPCALVGTAYQWIYDNCMFMKPEWTEQEVTQWQADHPACSYEWI